MATLMQILHYRAARLLYCRRAWHNGQSVQPWLVTCYVANCTRAGSCAPVSGVLGGVDAPSYAGRISRQIGPPPEPTCITAKLQDRSRLIWLGGTHPSRREGWPPGVWCACLSCPRLRAMERWNIQAADSEGW